MSSNQNSANEKSVAATLPLWVHTCAEHWPCAHGAAAAQELADAVFGEHLAEHLSMELAWLQQCYDSTAAIERGLSLQRVTEFLAWNQEARAHGASYA